MNTTALTALLVLPALLSGRGVRDGGREKVAPDSVEMVSGANREGKIVHIGEDEIVLRVGSRDQRIKREAIASLQSSLLTLPAALLRVEALAIEDFNGHSLAAEILLEQNLPLEAELLYWRALETHPSMRAAHEALGHKRRGSSWVVPHRGRFYPLDRLFEQREDWGGAWEFSTTHFDIRSNLELGDVIDSCFGLERVYQAFHQLFGAELDLYEITEPMVIWLHADEPSYRQPGGGRRGYFDSGSNRVSIDASKGLSLRTLVRESTHQLLYNSAQSMGSSGQLPGWLDEGLAQYVETVLDIRGGASILTPERASGRLFAKHAKAKKPYRLGRVLNFSDGDFWSSTKLSVKFAQAYTLVHFCLHGAEGHYRQAFLDYVQGAMQGKGSATHFKKSLGVKEREFEAQWSAYVSASTGQR